MTVFPPERLSPDAERQALDELVSCDGWPIFRALVQQAYGPEAQIRAIDEAMTQLRPGDSELAVVTQIRASGKTALTVLDLPASRLRQLQQGLKGQAPGPFAAFRRGPRPS
jgi:hypothetical protein